MDIHLLIVPYDSGHLGWRMGAGPDALLAAGLEQHLRGVGHAVAAERILLPADPPPAEIRAAFDLAAQIADRVRDARAVGALPVILAGNCISSLGTLAGLADADPAIVWLDAHADFNTPETTRSGMLDGTALAAATGRCWHALAAGVPGFRPVPTPNVCLVGTRDVDDEEAALLREAEVAVLSSQDLPVRMTSTLDTLRARAETVYLHIDLDVLDPEVGRANPFAAPDGLLLGQVIGVIRAIRRRFRIGAAAITAYDPACDPDGRIPPAALTLLHEITAPAYPLASQ
jgi:arginase